MTLDLCQKMPDKNVQAIESINLEDFMGNVNGDKNNVRILEPLFCYLTTLPFLFCFRHGSLDGLLFG